jgi:hypothetical protein
LVYDDSGPAVTGQDNIMKKRPEHDPRLEPVPVPPPLPLASADDFESGQLRCRVCGSPGASKRNEMLCWVCRRLKISAWKDIEKISLPE